MTSNLAQSQISIDGRTWYVSGKLPGNITHLLVSSTDDAGKDVDVCRGGECRHDVLIRTERGAMKLSRLDSYTVYVLQKYLGATFSSVALQHFAVHREAAISGAVDDSRFDLAEMLCHRTEHYFGYVPRKLTSVADRELMKTIRESRPWYTSIVAAISGLRRDFYGECPYFDAIEREWVDAPFAVPVEVVVPRRRKQVQRYKPVSSRRIPRRAITK